MSESDKLTGIPDDFPYKDILDKERPKHENDAFSLRHPKMERLERAKLFAPFAALKGFEESIDETDDLHLADFKDD